MARYPFLRVSKWDPKFDKLGYELAKLPATKATILAYAGAVSVASKQILARYGNAVPAGLKKYPLVYTKGSPRGIAFSARATAVAAQIKVKDKTILARFTNAPGQNAISVTRVAIVVADHPYSPLWERGTLGVPKSKFFTTATKDIAGRSPGVKRRAPRRMTAI